jgi:membrane protein DedA with SNARE-associated domain
MIGEMTRWIMDMMLAHGPAVVFLGVIIESVIVPIPSPLIIMGAGALLIQPGLSWSGAFGPILGKIVLPGAVASTLGAYFAFGIAYWGGKPMIDRFGRFLGFNWNDILDMEARLKGRVPTMIFLLRAAPIVPLSLISAAAGVLRLPLGPFTLWTFVGSLPRCLLLGYLGYLTRDTYEGLAKSINTAESLISAGIVAGVMAIILVLRARMNSTRNPK